MLSVEKVSHFLCLALSAEPEVLNTYRTEFPKYEKKLLSEPKIKSHRIAKNHAQLFALTEALFGILDFNKDQRILIREEIKSMAITRQDILPPFWN